MKVDLYTKTILTVIAGCLLYLVARDIPLVKEAHAQSRGPVEVNIVQIDGRRLWPYSVAEAALPVKSVQ